MSQEELVDIIDEKFNTIRTISKSESHKLGLLHKTVISEVIDSNGRWLLVKQSTSRQDAGQFVSPVGGHVTAGESEVNALKREAEEELGINGGIKYELLGRRIFNRQILERQENHLFVVFKFFSDAKPVLNHESESYRYFTESELRDNLKNNPELFGAPFHFVIKEFFQSLLD